MISSTILRCVTSLRINQYAYKVQDPPIFLSSSFQFSNAICIARFLLWAFFVLPFNFLRVMVSGFLLVFLVKLLSAIFFQHQLLAACGSKDMANSLLVSVSASHAKRKIRYSITRKRDYISLWLKTNSLLSAKPDTSEKTNQRVDLQLSK